MVETLRRYRREPGSVPDFWGKFQDQCELLSGVNPLTIGTPPESGNFKAGKFVETVYKILQENDPGSLHFILPMVGQQAISEFLKGVLHVLSPGVKVPVTSLKAPARFLLNMWEGEIRHFEQEQAERNLGEQVERMLEAHGSERTRTKFVVMDSYGTGTTKRALKRHLGEGIQFIKTEGFTSALIEEYHMTKDKTLDGLVNVSRGQLLDMLLKQDPENPKIRPSYMMHGGSILFESLKKMSRYFTSDECRNIRYPDWFEKAVRDGRLQDEWPQIIQFIRQLPDERKAQIVRKLKRDDAMLSRMAYQYGIAQAKEFMKRMATCN